MGMDIYVKDGPNMHFSYGGYGEFAKWFESNLPKYWFDGLETYTQQERRELLKDMKELETIEKAKLKPSGWPFDSPYYTLLALIELVEYAVQTRKKIRVCA